MLSLRSALLRSPAATVRGYVRQFCSTPAVDHLEVTVDGKAVSVPKDYTVLQACEAAGATVPRFCYHDRLSIAGNCRMCLVEIEKAPKPVASCAMPLMPGMNIKTNTPLVDKARQGVVEFLLVNHPLDCPICDQGGECDLQDQTLKYGRLRSRSFELRRGVEDKYIGPVVKTVMTRCIHCTRCVRFAEEIAGTEDLGATGRGNTMEIGTYVDKVFDSELSGNVVDLCPVGALTSKPFAFRARPWELERVETIDCHDSLGTNITIDYVGMDIMRVLPRLNEDINEEWLGDKSRLAYDGLKKQRLEHPMVRGKDGKFEKLLWHEALEEVERRLAGVDGRDIKGYAGDLVDAEAMISFKDLLNRLGCDFVDCRQDGSHVPADLRGDYTLASTIAGVDQADAVVLVGTNPRMEAALLNARIRKGFVQNGIEITSIGPKFTTTYPVTHLGNDLSLLNSSSLKAALGDAERPLVLVGVAAFQTADDASFTAQALAELRSAFPALSNGEWNGVNVLQLSAGRTAGMDLGLVPGVSGSAQKDAPAKVVFLLGADEVPDEMIPKDAFVIYQGSHGDRGAHRADLILPSSAWTEKSGTYVNAEGRVQQTEKVVGAPGFARDDWSIIRALSEVLGKTLPYSTISEVRDRLVEVAPHFASLDEVEPSSVRFSAPSVKCSGSGKRELSPKITNHWMTDPIARCSTTLAKCSEQMPNSTNSYH